MNRKPLQYACGFLLFLSFSLTPIDKNAFYKTLASGSEEAIDGKLKELDRAKPTSQVLAYQGALQMKKAEFIKVVKAKVHTFKAGAKRLESEIEKKPANVEYRFLRLTIQEHAPKILNYNKKIAEDKAVVVAGFEKSEDALKSVILNYTLTSKILKESDLKGK